MTLKQRKLAKVLGKSRTLQEAAIKAGYAPSTARQQQSITKTKGWKQLLDDYLPDERLLDRHDRLIESKNEGVALGAVALGYKVKGKLQAESVNNFNVGEMSVQFKEKE